MNALAWVDQTLLVGASTGIYLYHDLTTEPVLFDFSPVRKMHLSSQKHYLVSASSVVVRVMNWPSGTLLFTTPGYDATISIDERWLAIAQDNLIHVYKLPNFTEQHMFIGGNFVVFSPIQPDLLATNGPENDVGLWNVASGAAIVTLKGENIIFDVAFSPDGKWLAAGGWSGDVHLWNIQTNRLTETLHGIGWVYTVSFSQNSRFLFYTDDGGQIEVWDVLKAQPGVSRGSDLNWIWTPAYNRKDDLFATVGEGGAVIIWKLNAKQQASQKQAVLTDYTIIPEDSVLADQLVVSINRNGQMTAWNIQTGTRIASMSNSPTSVPNNLPFQMVTDRYGLIYLHRLDGQLIDVLMPIQTDAYNQQETVLAVSEENVISVQRLEHPETILTLSMAAQNLTLNLDGSRLAAVNRTDNTIWIWNLNTHERLFVLNGDRAANITLAFDHHSALLASAGDSTLKFWDTSTGTLVTTVNGIDDVWSLAFSPDDSVLLIGQGNGNIIVWNIANQSEIKLLSGHTDGVINLKFTADGTRFISTSHDGTVRLWGLAPSF